MASAYSAAVVCVCVCVSRGVYLATVFYHKDKVLVTAEEQLPLVEIQFCSTSITHDFLWFAKVSSSAIPTTSCGLIRLSPPPCHDYLWFAKVSSAAINWDVLWFAQVHSYIHTELSSRPTYP